MPIPRLLDRANQALQTLERYKERLVEVSNSLSALEVEDLVTIRDVVILLQRTEMVLRIADEIEGDIVELGADGRLVRLQLEEVLAGVEDERRLVVVDYLHEENDWHLEEAMSGLARLDTELLLDLKAVAEVLHLPEGVTDLDAPVQPKGHRLLARIPRLPESVIDRVVERFGNLAKILRATEARPRPGRGGGRPPGQGHQGGPEPPGRVEHPRPLLLTRLTCRPPAPD